MTYRPHPESLASRVIGFFALNPDEELTFEDTASKFVDQGDNRNIHTQLIAACDHDMLVYDPDEDVYRKGPVSLSSSRMGRADDDLAESLSSAIDKPSPARARKTSTSRQVAGGAPPPEISAEPPPTAESATKGIANGFAEHHQQAALPMDAAAEAFAARAVPQHTAPRADGPARQDVLPAQDHGSANGPEEARARPALAAGGSAGDARALPGSGRGGDCAGAGQECVHGESPGIPSAPADGHEPASAPTRHGEGDVRRDVPEGVDGQGLPAGLAEGQRAGAEPGTAGAVLPAHEHPQGSVGQAEAPIATVRQHLLNTLADLRNPAKPMAIDRAKAVAEVAAVLVNSAKVEVEYLKVTQQRRGQFFEVLPSTGGRANG